MTKPCSNRCRPVFSRRTARWYRTLPAVWFYLRAASGAEAITLSVGGHRSHTVVINVDDRRYRLKGLKGGEVALYTDEGDFIHFQRGRIAKLKVGKELILDTPLVRALGKIKAADDILDQTASDNVRTVREMREVYNGHNHPESGGGTTGNPNQEQ